MIPQEAIARFIDRMKHLLRRTYDEAWQLGVDTYEPDADPAQAPNLPRELALVGLTGAALLAVLRQYKYEAPAYPDALRRAIALAPAFRGLNRMATELGAVNAGAQLLGQWADANAARLDAGASVAWAGEQAGYAEAANADGIPLYQWMSAGDTRVCGDCEILSSFPPMALADWPTVPGAGDTECSVGCRCSWETWDQQLPASYSPSFTSEQAALLDALQQRQAQALSDMMPDAAYLT